MNKRMKTLLSSLLVLLLIAATALAFTACKGTQETPAPTASDTIVTDAPKATPAAEEKDLTNENAELAIGEGEKSFHFEVADLEGNTTYFLVKTDAENVGQALLDVNLIEGENGDYGLYVKTVNGVTADYNVDQTYWAFYINGEYAQTGVDSTPVEDGATYAFRISK